MSLNVSAAEQDSNKDLRKSLLKKDGSRVLSCRFESISVHNMNNENNENNNNDDDDDDNDDENNYNDDNNNIHNPSIVSNLLDSTYGETRTKLTIEQRKILRQSLQAVIMILITKSLNISEIKSFIYFLCQCEDEIVLEESLNMLLCMIIKDTTRKIISNITEIFKGSEEFSSFIACKFIKHSSESK